MIRVSHCVMFYGNQQGSVQPNCSVYTSTYLKVLLTSFKLQRCWVLGTALMRRITLFGNGVRLGKLATLGNENFR